MEKTTLLSTAAAPQGSDICPCFILSCTPNFGRVASAAHPRPAFWKSCLRELAYSWLLNVKSSRDGQAHSWSHQQTPDLCKFKYTNTTLPSHALSFLTSPSRSFTTGHICPGDTWLQKDIGRSGTVFFPSVLYNRAVISFSKQPGRTSYLTKAWKWWVCLVATEPDFAGTFKYTD